MASAHSSVLLLHCACAAWPSTKLLASPPSAAIVPRRVPTCMQGNIYPYAFVSGPNYGTSQLSACTCFCNNWRPLRHVSAKQAPSRTTDLPVRQERVGRALGVVRPAVSLGRGAAARRPYPTGSAAGAGRRVMSASVCGNAVARIAKSTSVTRLKCHRLTRWIVRYHEKRGWFRVGMS